MFFLSQEGAKHQQDFTLTKFLKKLDANLMNPAGSSKTDLMGVARPGGLSSHFSMVSVTTKKPVSSMSSARNVRAVRSEITSIDSNISETSFCPLVVQPGNGKSQIWAKQIGNFHCRVGLLWGGQLETHLLLAFWRWAALRHTFKAMPASTTRLAAKKWESLNLEHMCWICSGFLLFPGCCSILVIWTRSQ